ncbi:tetratricopeptide repeat family [Nannochloropsis oceanica]
MSTSHIFTSEDENVQRTQSLEALRKCTQEVAHYSDPQTEQEYVKLIQTLHKKATALGALHQHSQRVACVEKIIKLAKKGLPVNNLSLPKALETLAECHAMMGDKPTALTLFKEALDTRAACGLPEAHPSSTDSIKRMADLYRDQADFEQALELHLKVLELRRSLLSPGEARRGEGDAVMAEALHDVGTTYHCLGHFERAIPYAKKALEIKRELVARNKARREEGEKRRVEGHEEEEEEGEEAEEEDASDEYEKLMEMMYTLASTYAKNAEFTLAQPIYTELIARRRDEDPPNYIKLAKALNNAGAMHMEAGDGALALPFYEESLDILRMVLPAAHPEIALAMGNLAEVYRTAGENEKALVLFETSLTMQRRRAAEAMAGVGGGWGGVDPMGMACTLNNSALLYRAMENYPQVEKQMEEAIDWLKRAVPAEHYYVTNMKLSLAAAQKEGEEKKAGTYDPTKYGMVGLFEKARRDENLP